MISPRGILHDLRVWAHIGEFKKASDKYDSKLDQELKEQAKMLDRYKGMSDSQAHVEAVRELAKSLDDRRKTNGA